MTVQQLIDLLSNEPNKDKPVVLQCCTSSIIVNKDIIKVTSFEKMDLSPFDINNEEDKQLIELVQKDFDEEEEFIISFNI